MKTTEDELMEDVKHWKARADAAEAEAKRLRTALLDIQREAMTFKPSRHSWYYDRAQNALTNSDAPLVRDGLSVHHEQ